MVEDFKKLINEIIEDGNYPTFEFNSEDNDGVIVNEYDMIDDGGVMVANSMLTSQVFTISNDEALEAMDDLGLVYPEIIDWAI